MKQNGKPAVFVKLWLDGIMISVLPLICSVIFFSRRDIAVGIISGIWALLWVLWFIFLIPHSFLFDDEKITAIYVFRIKTVMYVHIKGCERQVSGVRTYPWREQYYIIADKPSWEEIKIPSTKETDAEIEEHIYKNPNVKISR